MRTIVGMAMLIAFCVGTVWSEDNSRAWDRFWVGQRLLGPTTDKVRLLGKVIYLEYWNTSESPVTRAQRLSALAEKLRGRAVHIVATHGPDVTSASVLRGFRFFEVNDHGNLTVTSKGRHPKFAGKSEGFFLLDHNGTYLKTLKTAPSAFKAQSIRRAVAKAPLIYLGPGPFFKVQALAASVERKKNLAKAVSELERQLAEAPSDVARAELNRIAVAVDRYRERALEEVDRLKHTDPSSVLRKLQRLRREFKGTTREPKIAETLKRFQSSDQLRAATRMQRACEKAVRSSLKSANTPDKTVRATIKLRRTLKDLLSSDESNWYAGEVRKWLESTAGR